MDPNKKQETTQVDIQPFSESGFKLQQIRNLAEAQLIYRSMLDNNPNNTDALYWFGALAKKLKKFDSAISLFSKIIDIDSCHQAAIMQRGQTFAMKKQHQLAIIDFTTILSLLPDSFEALYSRGVAQSREKNFTAAINDFTSAIMLNRESEDAYYNRALASKKLDKFDLAIQDYTRAIEINPYHFQAFNNRGLVFRELREFKKAIADFEHCTRTKPDFADAYFNKALTHLMIGEYESAWRLYEYRWDSKNFTSKKRHFDQPLWLGSSSLKNKTILLHSEQGLGDTLQFCRYVKNFDALDCNIVLEVERPLVTIMESLLPKSQIIEKGADLPNFDCHCPLMSLPLAFKTTIESVPSSSPYLFARPERVAWWNTFLGVKTKPRVGIAWQGNKMHNNDHVRSIKLSDLIPHLSQECDWFSLQIQVSDDDKNLIDGKENLHHFGEMIGDFSETAAFCNVLDAIICVDTSIAHLAGAIGRPTHLLLGYLSDSRWHEKGAHTPWYDVMRIYRQNSSRNWKHPLSKATYSVRNL